RRTVAVIGRGVVARRLTRRGQGALGAVGDVRDRRLDRRAHRRAHGLPLADVLGTDGRLDVEGRPFGEPRWARRHVRLRLEGHCHRGARVGLRRGRAWAEEYEHEEPAHPDCFHGMPPALQDTCLGHLSGSPRNATSKRTSWFVRRTSWYTRLAIRLACLALALAASLTGAVAHAASALEQGVALFQAGDFAEAA